MQHEQRNPTTPTPTLSSPANPSTGFVGDDVISRPNIKPRSLSLPTPILPSAPGATMKPTQVERRFRSGSWDGEAEERLLASMGYESQNAVLWSDKSPRSLDSTPVKINRRSKKKARGK